LRKSGNGVIVGLGDYESFRKKIIEISNGLLPKDSNCIGRQFVLDNYSKDVVTSKYVNLLKELD
jgi:glycosyltransferase involved in cell wall biosynthesis